jgi:hypothetical protein
MDCTGLFALNQFVLGLLRERKDERTFINEIAILLICFENDMRCVASKLLSMLTLDNYDYIIFHVRLRSETSRIKTINSCSVKSLEHKFATIEPSL